MRLILEYIIYSLLLFGLTIALIVCTAAIMDYYTEKQKKASRQAIFYLTDVDVKI